jgi:hypothetical protein
MVGDVLGDASAAEMGLHELEWTVGANPYQASFVWGVGRDYVVKPFSRPDDKSLGAVMPGPVTRSATDDTLTIAPYDDPSATGERAHRNRGGVWESSIQRSVDPIDAYQMSAILT